MKFYIDFLSIFIDDQWELFKISDHNLICTKISYGRVRKLYQQEKNITFNRKSKDAIDKYISYIKNNLPRNEIIDTQKFNCVIREAEDKCLKVTLKRKVKIDGMTEPKWLTKEIKENIALRRIHNKANRKAKNKNSILKKRYKDQKIKVHMLVWNAIESHEINITNEIMTDPNRGKNIWQHIHSLRNINKTKEKSFSLYDNNDIKIMENDIIKSEIYKYWSSIYNKYNNEIINKYNIDAKNKYKNSFEKPSIGTGKIVDQISIDNGILNYHYTNINIPNQITLTL